MENNLSDFHSNESDSNYLDDITTELGFYYVLYQPNPSKRVLKAWIDGDKSYKLYTFDKFLNFIPDKFSLIKRNLSSTFNQTSFFIWDVAQGTVQRANLSAGYHDNSDLKKEIEEAPKKEKDPKKKFQGLNESQKEFALGDSFNDTSKYFWKGGFNFGLPDIFKK